MMCYRIESFCYLSLSLCLSLSLLPRYISLSDTHSPSPSSTAPPPLSLFPYRALALAIAMMVYGKEESADTIIEQLSKDRGNHLYLHESYGIHLNDNYLK